MENLLDDFIISCIERTGFPPWMQDDEENYEMEDEEEWEE